MTMFLIRSELLIRIRIPEIYSDPRTLFGSATPLKGRPSLPAASPSSFRLQEGLFNLLTDIYLIVTNVIYTVYITDLIC